MLTLCTLAVLAGATGWATITRFAIGLSLADRQRIGLARGVPRAITLARLLRRLDADLLD
ncbi:transposase family protein, partial [Streptomyces sp. NPDC059161]